jgi:hypothetical protein
MVMGVSPVFDGQLGSVRGQDRWQREAAMLAPQRELHSEAAAEGRIGRADSETP